MESANMKALSYDELRALYKEFLHNQYTSRATIDTAVTDAFYLWRHGGKELFWTVVTAVDFENEARGALIKTLSEKSSGNVSSLISSYMSHVRRFRSFLALDETTVPVEGKRQTNARPKPVSREIIINKMYVGAFLSEGENIGHEIINLYKADNGKNYLYLNSQGTIDLTHGESSITVLLVRKSTSKVYKVLAKAEGITILPFADSKLLRRKRYQGQVALGLTYGGIRLVDLFGANSYRGSLEEAKNTYATFVADRVVKPKNAIYITDDESVSDSNVFFIRTNKGFGKQTLREFYNEYEKPASFADLNGIIQTEELWEETNTTQTISELPQLQEDPHFNFLKIIRQEDNELVFSNMFAHFFNAKRDIFSSFAREVLSVEMQTEFTIEREKKNIDLLVSDQNNVVVIENKIKSNINGVNERYDIYSDQVQSQLNKYYQFVTTDNEYSGKRASCYIFSPNYNRIELSRFSCGEKYTVVYYREIHDFFAEHRRLFDGVPYFEDFINALHKHTKDYDDELEEEMRRKFQNAILKAKRLRNGTQ